MTPLQQISLEEWDARYDALRRDGLQEPSYGGRLGRHIEDGDLRLSHLKFDPSPSALRLWNFLLTEEERLRAARHRGHKIVGTMKDLGTIPVMAYAADNCTAFYPDGAWWIPCVMELSAGLLQVADSLGIDDSFCPVRAMLGAFATEAHFPIPDLLICSVGAVCDDFSAIAQRLNGMGHPILWWEILHRRTPDTDEEAVQLPGGLVAPRSQVDFVKAEMTRIRDALASLTGNPLDDEALQGGIHAANGIRRTLADLRHAAFTAEVCPMPALEMLIAEMLVIHFCSDRDECATVLSELYGEAERRIRNGDGYFGKDAARVFWVNPVADLRAMNMLEACGGRVCGTEYLFSHALDPVPEDQAPLEALARAALADPMVGDIRERAQRIVRDARRFGSEAVLISRIPGASHCAIEGQVIAGMIREQTDLPVAEIEVPPLIDSMQPTLRTRIEALIETVKERR